MLKASGTAGLCCGDQSILRFFGVGSRQLKLIRAGLAFQGAEWNSRWFFEVQDIRMIQRADLADQNRLPLIPDHGLVCYDSACSAMDCAIPILE
jgi:hypothetical protein